MKNMKWFSPYDPTRRIGSVINVSASEVTVNLSKAGSGEPSWSFGSRIAAGEVNEFVFIDVGETAILGKLIKVWIEGGERLTVDDLTDKPYENHPIGLVQLLVSLDSTTGLNFKGVKQYPRLGSQLYSAHPKLVSQLAEGKQDDNGDKIYLPIAFFPNDPSVSINVTPENLFSRHCAILGATGGGKSYSMTTLIEQVKVAGGKAIVIDPTGEYSSLGCETFYVGNHHKANSNNKVTFPHWQFTDSDIRAFLRPSAQSQSPKLDAAIESQKIVWNFWNAQPQNLTISPQYILMKSGQLKEPYENSLLSMTSIIDNAPWIFKNLPEQIVNECVWPNGGVSSKPIETVWGGRADNDVGHCLNLISRIKSYANNVNLKWMIDVDTNLQTIPNLIDAFCMPNYPQKIIRLDLSEVPFEANSREILVNATGRKLLSVARKGLISHENPLLVFIDEAHQFLNKTVGEDSSKYRLDSFGDISKEGRKYGLNTVIATQRPRDIPEDVLSQIGTLIVHRLTNHLDQEIVKRSVGAIDQRSASFLPVLGQGEALMLGVDFPFPMTVKIKRPINAPTSKSASFSHSWRI